MGQKTAEFTLGLRALTELTDGTVYVCKSSQADVPGAGIDRVQVESFDGPHPAGLVGTHIHFLDPVGPTKTVWYIGYQDVCAIGSFLQTGLLDTSRIISLAGPVVSKPRLLQTTLGASVTDLIDGEYDSSLNIRPISGSVLNGRKAISPFDYLGRYHNQISLIEEGDEGNAIYIVRTGSCTVSRKVGDSDVVIAYVPAVSTTLLPEIYK